MIIDPERESDLIAEALRLAWTAREQAYAKYSDFKVGAAIFLPELQSFVTGVNVENVSYGATICAERSAVVRAVAERGPIKIGLVAVVSSLEPAITPCGMCLQVLQEFGSAETIVVSAGPTGQVVRFTLGELMPHGFREFRAD